MLEVVGDNKLLFPWQEGRGKEGGFGVLSAKTEVTY